MYVLGSNGYIWVELNKFKRMEIIDYRLVTMGIYFMTPIAFTLSIIRDIFYYETEYNIRDVAKGDLLGYLITLSKKFFYNFMMVIGVVSIFLLFLLIVLPLGYFEYLSWSYFFSVDFYILITIGAFLYMLNFENKKKNKK